MSGIAEDEAAEADPPCVALVSGRWVDNEWVIGAVPCGEDLSEHAYLMHQYLVLCPHCNVPRPVAHLMAAAVSAAKVEALVAAVQQLPPGATAADALLAMVAAGHPS